MTEVFYFVHKAFTAEEFVEFNQAFAMRDEDQDERISTEKLLELTKSLDMVAVEGEMFRALKGATTNKGDTLDMDESLAFFAMVRDLEVNKVFTAEEVAELKQLFVQYDGNQDGRISTKELLSLTMSLGETASEEDVLFVIKSFDKDGDGALDVEEYLDLMANLRSIEAE
ncbi:calmodulin-like 3 [Podila verticillata]|nr:calmodulin-like 3 [Podila verticillata]